MSPGEGISKDKFAVAAKPIIEGMIGDAKSTTAKVRRIVGGLLKDGDELDAVDQAATMTRGAKLAKVYVLRKGLDPALRAAVMDDLRNKIKSSTNGEESERTLREDERQDFDVLVFRGCFKMPRTTAWRYKKLVEYLESFTDLDPGLWGQEILHRGGLLKCIADAAKAKKQASSASDTRPLDNEPGLKGADQEGEEDVSETLAADKPEEDDCQPSLSEPVQERFAELPEGIYLLPTLWSIDSERAEAMSVSDDEIVCDPIFKSLRKGEPIDWHGADPADFKAKIINAPTPPRFGKRGMQGWRDTRPNLTEE